MDEEDSEIYTTRTNYYLKYMENESIDVYNFNNKLVSHTVLKTNEKYRYNLIDVLDNGMFIIYCEDKEGNDSGYDLYDVNGNLIIEKSKDLNIVQNVEFNNGIIVNNGDNEVLLINKDNKVMNLGNKYIVSYTSSHNKELMEENHFIMISETTNNIKKIKIMNLDTLKSINCPIKNLDINWRK